MTNGLTVLGPVGN